MDNVYRKLDGTELMHDATLQDIAFGYSHLVIEGGSFDPGNPFSLPLPTPPTITPPDIHFEQTSVIDHQGFPKDAYMQGEMNAILDHLIPPGTFQETDLYAPTEGFFNGYVASFMDNRMDLSIDPSRYTATINWGDGSDTSIGTVTYNAGRSDLSHRYYDVSSNHYYGLPGGTALFFSVDISTSDGGTASLGSVPSVVGLRSLPPQFTNPSILTVFVGDTSPLPDLSAVDAATGNTLGSSADYYFGIDGRLVEGPNATGRFAWTPQPGDVGTHTATVVVEDYRASFVPTVTSTSFQLIVKSGLPQLTSLSPSDQPTPTTLGVHNLGSDQLTLTANGLNSPRPGALDVYFYRDNGGDGNLDFYLGKADTLSGTTATWSHQVGLLSANTTYTFFALPVRYLSIDTLHVSPLRGNPVKTTIRTVPGIEPPPVAFPVGGAPPGNQVALAAVNNLDDGYAAVDSSGNIRAIWTQRYLSNSTTYYDVYTQLFDPSGNPIVSAGASTSGPKYLVRTSSPVAAVMESSTGYLALASLADSYLNVYWFQPNGTQMRGVHQLLPVSMNASHVVMASDNHGSLLIAYQAGAVGSEDVYATTISQYIYVTQAPWTVNTHTNGVQIDPTVALNSNGDGVIAWQDSNQNQIIAQRVVRAEDPQDALYHFGAVGANMPVSDSGSLPTSGGLASAINSAGVFLLAWAHNSIDVSGIYARLFGHDGQPVGRPDQPFLANQFTGGVGTFHTIPQVALNDFGMAVIGYTLSGSNTGAHSRGAYGRSSIRRGECKGLNSRWPMELRAIRNCRAWSFLGKISSRQGGAILPPTHRPSTCGASTSISRRNSPAAPS